MERGLPLYIIGGFVRDLFLGHASLDFDLVTEGDAVAFARHVCRKYGGKITVHSQFGTASWYPDLDKLTILKGESLKNVKLEPLDFVTARSETYPHPGRPAGSETRQPVGRSAAAGFHHQHNGVAAGWGTFRGTL